MKTQDPAEWVLDLICCGRSDGHQGCPTWDAAVQFRDSYTTGAGTVDPHGYSGDGYSGHQRCAILRSAYPGESMGWRE